MIKFANEFSFVIFATAVAAVAITVALVNTSGAMQWIIIVVPVVALIAFRLSASTRNTFDPSGGALTAAYAQGRPFVLMFYSNM